MKVGGVSSYMVSSRPSGVLNWEYYVYYDMNQGQFVGARLSGVIVLSILIIVITCFFMTSYTIYRPVGKLEYPRKNRKFPEMSWCFLPAGLRI